MIRALPLLIALVAACKGKAAPTPEDKKVTVTSTDDATEAIVDEEFRFQLAWPGDGWKLLREADARHLAPDAVAALSKGAVHAIVIVEHAPGMALDGFADLVIENVAVEDKQVERTASDLAGTPAVRVDVTGTLNDMPIRFRGLILLHQDHAYQVMAFGPADVAAAELDAAIGAFSILPGPVTGRAQAVAVRDQVGVGWRVDQGVFESAVSRVRVAPPEGWRLLVGPELYRTNPDAEVGLAAEGTSAYVAVISEPIAAADLERYRRDRLAQLHTDAEAAEPPWTARTFGREVTFARARTTGGAAFEYLLGVLHDGHRAHQVLAWYPTSLRDTVEPLLGAAVGAIAPLDDAGHRALLDALATARDGQNDVGASHALRGGVYLDFAHGLRWKKPSGFWRVAVGQDARAENQDATLAADEVLHGLQSQIFVEPAAGFTTESLHEIAVGGLASQGFVAERSGAATIGGHPARFTEGRLSAGELSLRYRTTSAVIGDRAVQVGVWTTVDWPAPAIVEAPADAVELLPLAVVEEGPPYRDHRLGFEMRMPGAWTRSDVTPSNMSAVATMQRWARGRAEVLVAAVFAFEQTDETWMLDMIEQILRTDAAKMTAAKPTSEPHQVAGLPGRHVVWQLGLGRADAYLVQRDATFYLVMAVDPTGDRAADQLARDGFSLLP